MIPPGIFSRMLVEEYAQSNFLARCHSEGM